MKEASGELNMTLVTVLAIGAILAFAMLFVPQILNKINDTWTSGSNNTIGTGSISGGGGGGNTT